MTAYYNEIDQLCCGWISKRQGHEPEAIAAAIEAKQTKNEGRQWPDWRTAEPGKAIEHVREELFKRADGAQLSWNEAQERLAAMKTG